MNKDRDADIDSEKDKQFNSLARFEHSTAEGETNVLDVAPFVSFDATIAIGATETCQWIGSETVLLVEDEALVRRAIQEALQSAGYSVITAENAARALDAYHECSVPVDLLLSDVVMPGISGHELAESMFALCPHIRIMLISGYSEQLSPRELSAFQKKYLAKPFSISTLLKRIREALDGETLDRDPIDFERPLSLRSLCGNA
ncbi:MAG: response regulator [Candidatus Sulfotelmatobacter sp.]